MSELVGSRALADGDVTDSARSSASYEFATRIIESSLVHLCDPGVEVTNKPHERCTVVRVKVKSADHVAMLSNIFETFYALAVDVVEADVDTTDRPTAGDGAASAVFLVQDAPTREKVSSTKRLAESLRGALELDDVGERTRRGEDAVRAGDDSARSSPRKPLSRGEKEKVSATATATTSTSRLANVARREDGGELLAGESNDAVTPPATPPRPRRVSSVCRDGLKLNSCDVHATEIHMEIPDRVGLLRDVANALSEENLRVVHAHVYTTPDGMASNYFSVECASSNTKVPSHALEKVRAALAARCHRDAVPHGHNSRDSRDLGSRPTTSQRTEAAAGSDDDARERERPHLVAAENRGAREVARRGGETTSVDGGARRRRRTTTTKPADALNALPPARPSGEMSDADAAFADDALRALPAYRSLASRAARDEILDELRIVRWAPGEIAFRAGDAIPNTYLITSGGFVRDAFSQTLAHNSPRLVLRRGDLVGEVATHHAYKTHSAIRSVDENGAPVETTAFAINCETFKRIVRTRIHRQRRLCNNVLNIVSTFRAVSTRKKELLLNALWSASVAMPPGTKLDFGTMSKALHVIIEGEVDVVPLHSKEKKKTLSAGDTFGNDFLMSPEMYARAESENLLEDRLGHSYVCKTHTVLLLVTRGLLESLWGESFDSLLSFRCVQSRKNAKRNWQTGLTKVKASLTRIESAESLRLTDGPKLASMSCLDLTALARSQASSPNLSPNPSPSLSPMQSPRRLNVADLAYDDGGSGSESECESPSSVAASTPGVGYGRAKSRFAEPETPSRTCDNVPSNGKRCDDAVSEFATTSEVKKKKSSMISSFKRRFASKSALKAKKATASSQGSATTPQSDAYRADPVAKDPKDPFEGYAFAKPLGDGLIGSVYKCWKPNVNKAGVQDKEKPYVAVAVKVMSKAKILDINETEHVVRESSIMKAVCRHPFIATMTESFQTPSALCIVMEYAAGKDLFFLLHEVGSLSLFQTRAYFVQVVLALEHVHHKGFVYRDLKPENLLVREDGYLRLTDFGFAKALKPGERAYTVCGTPDYLSPEALRGHGCNRAADFWALGILLFEMMAGYPPFYGQTHSELYRRITEGKHRTFPNTMNPHAQDLIRQLLRQEEGERIGMCAKGIQAIRSHPFFKGFSWTAVLEQRVDIILPSKIEPDADVGPEDITEPCEVPCLTEPCVLTDNEQKLFEGF